MEDICIFFYFITFIEVTLVNRVTQDSVYVSVIH